MRSTDNLSPRKVGYVIPEFPGQTHIWMWRELQHLREWGLDVALISTRRPDDRDRARHAWADAAATSTRYLWPTPPAPLAAAVAWAALRRPVGWLRAVRTAASLPLEAGRTRALALLAPAAVLARHVVRSRIDHLHAHTCGDAAVICLLAGRITGTPYSLTLNADIEWWGGAMAEKFGGAAFTVAITRWLLDELHRDFPNLRPDQTLLGRIGVDTRRWTPAEMPAHNSAGTLRLLTLGRLHEIKGHDVLLRAVAELADEGYDVTLRLAGDGPERAALEALARDLGVADRVTFLGSVSEDEALRQMRASDAFALASNHEPLGVAYMEAMSVAVPTVGTATGGVAEIIDDGETGLLVPPGDPAALAHALRRLTDDPPMRQRLGEAGRRSIEQRFDSRLGATTLYERLRGAQQGLYS